MTYLTIFSSRSMVSITDNKLIIITIMKPILRILLQFARQINLLCKWTFNVNRCCDIAVSAQTLSAVKSLNVCKNETLNDE